MRKIFLALLLLGCSLTMAAGSKHTFAIANGSFLYDGKPIQIHSGEMHYSRIPAPYWRHRLRMMKAMGLNCVATYVFWNHHELAPGKWDWQTDNRNLRQFLTTAQQEGMMVILRPGPYGCGEWEFGGYPWWLQKAEGMVIRSYNRAFLDSCSTYIHQLTDQMRELQVTHGGPVIMVQCENEFGSYVAQRKDIPLAEHKRYSKAIYDLLHKAGIDVPLFTSDGDWLFKEGTIEGVFPTANGETNVANLHRTVNPYTNNQGPYMVAEYYPGWLDHWNEPFQRVSTEQVVGELKAFLDSAVNFNIYMVHGGTNYGFTSGANYTNETNLQPDLTSYDYDAPISEAGWNTPKYDAVRKLMQKYSKRKLPKVPARIPVISIDNIQLTKSVDLLPELLKQKPTVAERPLTFEDLGQGHGYVLYRWHADHNMKGTLYGLGIADYGVVYVDGKQVGVLNRVTDKYTVDISLKKGSTLDILVENFGRINYGARITDNLKGFTCTPVLNGRELSGGWEMYGLPMDRQPDLSNLAESYEQNRPVLYSGSFDLAKTGDTFLDMERWGKGIVFVNGHNLGRYWQVGPQQTLYLPGCWLREKGNTIVVFEQLNKERQTAIHSLTTPKLYDLKKE